MAGGRPHILVVGGGIVGASVAWHLARDLAIPARITVVERDPAYRASSTHRSAAGIRQQFTNTVNIRLSRYGIAFLRRFRGRTGGATAFRENGYLILAGDEVQAAALREAGALQRAEGAATELLSPAEIAARFPHLATGDLTLGSLGMRDEGWFDPVAVLGAMRDDTRAAGVDWRRGDVVAVRSLQDQGRVEGVALADGTMIDADWVVLAAGVRAASLAATAGLILPVEPRKRTVFCVTCAAPPTGHDRLPLMIDPSGLWCRPEGAGFIAGRAPEPDPPVAPEDLEPRSTEFEDIVWPALAARAPCFEAARMSGLWAGHYAWNTHDQNAILGPAPGLDGLLLACGFSGHGVQHAPGVGRALAEWIADGRYRTVDIAPLHADRLSAAPTVEANIY